MSLKVENPNKKVGDVMSDLEKQKIIDKHNAEQKEKAAEESSRTKAAFEAFKKWNAEWAAEFNCVLVPSVTFEGLGPNMKPMGDIGIKTLPKK